MFLELTFQVSAVKLQYNLLTFTLKNKESIIHKHLHQILSVTLAHLSTPIILFNVSKIPIL